MSEFPFVADAFNLEGQTTTDSSFSLKVEREEGERFPWKWTLFHAGAPIAGGSHATEAIAREEARAMIAALSEEEGQS
jgi:hypothetical protein